MRTHPQEKYNFDGNYKGSISSQRLNMPYSQFMKLINFRGFRRCHICKQISHLVLDHEHVFPFIIRGALCNECNLSLGKAERGFALLSKAQTDYLENWPTIQLGIRRSYIAFSDETNGLHPHDDFLKEVRERWSNM